MKKILLSCFLLVIITTAKAQLVGIGTDNATRAMLEVWGAAGPGKTAAIFGGARGVSLHRNYAGIGLNQYFDNSTNGRYLGDGYAAVWRFVHDDATLSQGLSLTIYPAGTTGNTLPAGIKAWDFSLNNRWRIVTPGSAGINGQIDVGRSNGNDGTAMFLGTNRPSHFAYGTTEDTYIRGGKPSSKLFLNDITGGNVILGNGSSTVGVNTNYYLPPTTLEVRQSNGGMELTNALFPAEAWEWRTATGSPANFQLYYSGGLRGQFAYTNGAYSAVSDARLKTDVESLPYLLDKLMQLQPVSYGWLQAPNSSRRNIGFIAQQVQPLFPMLVATSMGENGELLGLDYSGFNVIAVKGVQEEQTQLNTLDDELKAMQKRMDLINEKLKSRKQ